MWNISEQEGTVNGIQIIRATVGDWDYQLNEL